ncbi:MAG TPA: TonB-dependent receptor [Chitinophagales bacterium]|nr:TonB-dependent receptor [Chitinophagales bacterium]
MKKQIYLFLLFIICHAGLNAQDISGILLDKKTGEPMIGATVSVKGTGNGTVTDIDGKFELKITETPPLTLVFTYIGYTPQEIAINSVMDLKRSFNIKLESEEKSLGTVEVVDSRITEKEKQSPLTIESMGLGAIKQTASSTFYEGLGTLKGVDMTAASLGFVVINTRGFNSTSPVRSLQLLDGADNQSPGLNFSVGNFAGASEIDIQKVDLIVGASSPLYGPNAFNGVINLQTKNPFYHNGLSIYVKGAERNLFEGAIRYAKSFKNKSGEDKFAMKFNFSYLRALDWQANNLAAATNSWQPATNYGGYDAVNRYGDELPTKNSLNFDDPSSRRLKPGLGQIFRTGYEEKDVLNYNIKNIKASSALHYKITDKIEARVAYNFGYGTTVYQGDNRYSINDIRIHQIRAEIVQQDKFYLRAYTTMENAGNSYDGVFTAIKLQDAQKSIAQWSNAYSQFWSNGGSGVGAPVGKVNNLLGVYSPSTSNDIDPSRPGFQNYWFPATITTDTSQWDDIRAMVNAAYDSILAINGDSLTLWHSQARTFADTISSSAFGKPRLVPGTKEYNDSLKAITSRTAFEQNGTQFFDRSKLFHVQGEYKIDVKKKNAEKNILDILVGASFRMYFPDSRGTIFSDTITDYEIRNRNSGQTSKVTVNEYNALQKDSFEIVDFTRRKITNWEVGAYLSLNRKFELDEFNALILTATVRFDRNQNFAWKRKDGKWDPIITPAASIVYSYKNNHTVRLSFSSAVRNPTLQDQFLYYNVGRAILIGNLYGVDSLVTVESFQDYLGSTPNDKNLLKWFDVPAVRPEKVQTLELGYKGIIAKKVFLDGSAYVSWYRDFLGYQIGTSLNSTVTLTGDTNYSIRQIYRVAANASDRVMTYGASVGFNYFFINNYSFNGNYSWNRLDKRGSSDPIIPAFNTPEHKFNVGISGKDIKLGNVKGFAFNVNFKWIKGFVFEGSPQFSGSIPSYSLLDAQVSYEWAKIYTTFKLGGSNLVSKKNYQVYGGPAVGRMIYGSLLVNIDQDVLEGKNKKKPKTDL